MHERAAEHRARLKRIVPRSVLTFDGQRICRVNDSPEEREDPPAPVASLPN